MARQLRILILEDVATDAALMERQLGQAGLSFTSKRVATREDFLGQLDSFRPDIVLADYRLPAYGGAAALSASHQKQPALPFIFVSGSMGEETVVESLRRGATDYVLKDKLTRLGPVVKRALAESEKKRELQQAEAALAASEARYRSLVDASPDAIVVADLSGKLSFANQQARRLFGYGSLKQLLAVDLLDLVQPADRKKAAKSLKAAQQDAHLHNDELCFVKRGGGSFQAEMSSTIVNDHDRLSAALMVVVRDISTRKEAEAARLKGSEKLKTVLDQVVKALASTVEQRDPYTAGHQVEVARLSCAIARALKLSDQQIEAVGVAATLHDIGKIGVPTEILVKPGKITESELNVIKAHSRIGHDILSTIDFPWPVAEIVLQHHEREDGSGYPQGLEGDDIMIEARIICVADVIEAMSSHRPYRPSLGVDSALEHIILNRGKLYHGPVVDACVNLFIEEKFELAQAIAGNDDNRDKRD